MFIQRLKTVNQLITGEGCVGVPVFVGACEPVWVIAIGT